MSHRKQFFITLEGISHKVLRVEADSYATAIREAKQEFAQAIGTTASNVAVTYMSKRELNQ
jgi:protoheme ferro-lyase